MTAQETFEQIDWAYRTYLTPRGGPDRAVDVTGLWGYGVEYIDNGLTLEPFKQILFDCAERKNWVIQYYREIVGVDPTDAEVEHYSHQDQTLTQIYDLIVQDHASNGLKPKPVNIVLIWAELGIMSTGMEGFITGHYPNFTLDEAKWIERVKWAKRHRANTIRALPFGVWWMGTDRSRVISPFQFIASRNLWDLSKLFDQYFAILKRHVEIAADNGIAWLQDLYDDCQLHSPESRLMSPYVNNINGASTPYNAPHSCNLAYLNRLIEVLRGLPVFYTQGNELKGAGTQELFAYQWGPFQTDKAPLHGYGPTVLTTGFNECKAQAQQALGAKEQWMFRMCHGTNNVSSQEFTYACSTWGGKGKRIFVSNDGAKQPTLDQWKGICRKIKQYPLLNGTQKLWAVELLRNNDFNLDFCAASLDTIAAEFPVP